MEMNNDIFTPDLPIPEPVSFEDAPIPTPVEEETPAAAPPPRRRRKADAPVLTTKSKPKMPAKPPRGMRFTTPTAHGASSLRRWAASSRPTATRRLPLWTTTVFASSSLSRK